MRRPVGVKVESVRTNASDPTGSCRTAIFRAGVEGDGRLWRGTMDGVDHRFKQNQAIGWQAEAGTNHDAVVAMTGQAAFNPSGPPSRQGL
jgi:hypothetical protein